MPSIAYIGPGIIGKRPWEGGIMDKGPAKGSDLQHASYGDYVSAVTASIHNTANPAMSQYLFRQKRIIGSWRAKRHIEHSGKI